MFERIIAIDWSGAGTDDTRVDLRIVECHVPNDGQIVEPPARRRGIRSWTRNEAKTYLAGKLRANQPRTLVIIDFGFGLPWGADRAAFNCVDWRSMVDAIARRYSQAGTARLMAETLNAEFGHGPYRFNGNRCNPRFYLDKSVAYYRLTEIVVPQAISQWYLGSGGTVGFHTITGLAALSRLLAERDAREIAFHVWPQEGLTIAGALHVVAEGYPAVCAALDTFGPCRDDHERDAWRMLQLVRKALLDDRLHDLFRVPELRCGRVQHVGFQEQVGFEGWILGV